MKAYPSTPLSLEDIEFPCYHFAVMKAYELMVIYKSELKDAGAKKDLATLTKQITSLKGKVTKEDYWGVKDMAYIMEKQMQGYYAVVNFEIDPTQVKGLST